MKLPRRNTPRWIIFLLDLGIVLFSFILAFMLRFDFNITESGMQHLISSFPLFVFIRVILFLIGRTYAGIIRYTSTEDALRIFVTLSIGSVLFVLCNFLKYYAFDAKYFIPFSIIIIEFLGSLFLLNTYRVGIKLFYIETRGNKKEKVEVIIYGAGELGMITKRTLERDLETKYKVEAFIDDNKTLAGKKLEGVKIYKRSYLEDLLANNDISELIIAIPDLVSAKKEEVINTCLNFNVHVKTVPSADNWINGELSLKQIKDINIEDLLEREQIKLNIDKVREQLDDKVVLITGAAGSIGSEIVRQVMNYSPSSVVLLDQSETQLYELDIELRGMEVHSNYYLKVASIRDENRIKELF
ncbi:MAG: polysaccharide biosynthesis protein, partial [Flavobacteriales bacterium]